MDNPSNPFAGIDPNHPHVQAVAQLQPQQLHAVADRLQHSAQQIRQAGNDPTAGAPRSLSGGLPPWLGTLLQALGPVAITLIQQLLQTAGAGQPAQPTGQSPDPSQDQTATPIGQGQ